VSLLPIDQVTNLPDPTTVQLGGYSGQSLNELKTIELQEITPSGTLCRIGDAVTNDEFRRWQLENNWATPVDTLLVEVTIAGVTQAICHGGGISHATIPDLVHRVEYVYANGNLQAVRDPILLTAAAGKLRTSRCCDPRNPGTGSHEMGNDAAAENRCRPSDSAAPDARYSACPEIRLV
jgi:hypothetical protein